MSKRLQTTAPNEQHPQANINPRLGLSLIDPGVEKRPVANGPPPAARRRCRMAAIYLISRANDDSPARTDVMGKIKNARLEAVRNPARYGQASPTVRVALLLRDVTARRREKTALRDAQAALAHACRVNTMGELAASIAHEVNQPIAGVATNAKACLRWLERVVGAAGDLAALGELREGIRRIIRDGQRAGEIIARTRSLCRKTETIKGSLEINKIIHDILVLTRSELSKHRIALRLNLSPDLPEVLGDAVQIQQVLMNLILNAVQAMSAMDTGPRQIVIRTEHAGHDRVCIEVQDSGIGLNTDRPEEIFKAFHTTKAGGMGMGLSISRSIVENHGGTLSALAPEGPGAIFRFTLLQYAHRARSLLRANSYPETCHE